jgi:hypothetical protein
MGHRGGDSLSPRSSNTTSLGLLYVLLVGRVPSRGVFGN